MLTTPSETTIGVIIPYFQREAGLLSRAVRSVLDQSGATAGIIIIVDDGSPVPARSELAIFGDTERDRIMLIEQSNAGVSAARNRALDALPSGIKFIAFLDPDDVWHPDHLHNAMVAFDVGADFYFTDFMRDNQPSRFSRSKLATYDHTSIGVGVNLFRYCGGAFIQDVLRRTFVGTSTVVLKRELCANVIFQNDISAGEDILFWISCLRGTDFTVIFSSRCETMYGAGVGLISNATWGSRRSMQVARDHYKMLTIVKERFTFDPDFDHWIDESRKNYRRDFCRTFLHRLRRLQSIDLGLCWRFFKSDPRLLGAFFIRKSL
jgi:succinoglycan biosynthesis protein ExoW